MTNSKKNSSKKISKKCSKGKILRNGYTTKKGSKVPSSCITAQSDSGKKTSLILKKYLQKKAKMHREARKRFSKEVPKKCSKGEILKEGYKKNSYKSHSKTGKNIKVSGSWTKPACIKSVTGKSKKGSKLITIMDKDVLGKYGYSNVKSLSKTERHSVLRDALKKIKPLSVYRRLIALATLYGWVQASDHQFLYSKNPPRLIYSVDHGHFFPNPPNWSIKELLNAPSAQLDPYFDNCGFVAKEFSYAYCKLMAIAESQIIQVVSTVPDEWDFTMEERLSVVEYLIKRQKELLYHLQ